MLNKKQLETGKDFLLYGLSFMLLMEWLLPLPYITDTGYIFVFVLITAVFFFITFLQLPVMVSMLLKSLLICYGLYLVFIEGPFFSMEWVTVLLSDLFFNVRLMIAGEWYALTDMFRSFLFYVLLAIMSYLLFYWTVHARRVLFFLVFTVAYITVIDTFTIYDASFAIIRIFIIGFLLLGLVTMYRMIEQQPIFKAPKMLPVRLATLLVLLIGAGGLLGLLSPKLDPQWEDPVPFVRAAVGMGENGAGEGVQRIGYGDHDEQLGGGFIDDDTPVFYATSSREHYWRGETKDYYTGKGWETTTPVERKEFLYADRANVAADYEQLEAVIELAEQSNGFNHLFYPGELVLDHRIQDFELFQDAYTGKASTYQGARSIRLAEYYIEYFYPVYQIDGLRAINNEDPEPIRDYYTQLPDELPERVRDLAIEITEEEDNRYDKAKAIELYFGRADFQYETQDVPIPGEGEDYVDQFLFETMRGYCDNFSTAMIVMLRSIDIPARWAKGFTQGELVESVSDTHNLYKVTNGNAHSWVEVYFPDVGWVAFEPTQGFDNAYEFNEPEVEVDETEEETRIEEEEDTEEQEVEDVFADLEGDDEETSASSGAFQNWTIPGGPWVLMVLVVAVFVFVLSKNKRLVQYYLLRKYGRRQDEEAFLQAYDRLLWLLNYFGWKRENGETLREYAIRLDQEFETVEMMSLTMEYERIMYGGQSLETSWLNQKSNWLSFVRKIES
ncbi:transglutaminase-like enzymes [Halalkalibacter wakoensis JCM 9140]|uniref:Transglutaminase-like enzymes n=1 Tax=Halalkalibacter wakoensis JCM 9140 TaxID=1236970 RepID=W4Q3V8_9BACI|nr:transglutaminase domain-containing protein [Halalkalibacter wakoensis]GAE26635.1 transglutaminase-like enzymes [Halalkalibacter wakoensis JCM 9140]